MADEKILIEVEIDNKQAQANEIALIKAIERSKQELALRRKELKKSNGTNEEAAKRIGELTRQINSNNTQLRNNQKELRANDNSINGLRASVSRLTAERNNLDTSTKEGAKNFAQLTKKIKEQNDQLKELEGSAGDFRRNVGDYTNSIKQALGETDIFTGGLGDLFASFTGVGQIIKNIIPLITSLRGAMLALPILAIATALASLVSFFTKTRKGAQELEKILGGINGVIGFLVGKLSELGATIFNTLKNAKNAFSDLDFSFENIKNQVIELGESLLNNLVNRFKAVLVFGDAIAALFDGKFSEASKLAADAVLQVATGVEDSTTKLKELIQPLTQAATQGFNLAKANIALRDSIRSANLEAANQQRIAEQNRKIRDDERLSLEERLEANNRVLEAEKLRTQAQERAVRARIQLIRNEAKTSKNLTEEQLEQINDFNIELADIQEDFLGRTTEQLTEEVSIRREAEQQKAQARVDGINAQLLALEEGSQEFIDKQIELINEEARLQELQAAQEITNQENLNARLLLIEAQRVAAIKDLKQQELDAIEETAKKKQEAADKEREAAEKQAQAEEKKQAAIAKTAVQSGIAAAEQANNAKEVTQAVLNSVRAQVKARLAEALAVQIAKSITTVPFPINLLIASTAGAALSTLFEQLIPAFANGGVVNSGLPINRNNGDNVLITAKKGEVILNKQQQARVGFSNLAKSGIAGFANGGVVGATLQSNAINNSVLNDTQNTAALMESIKNLPNPILDYKEFTRFQDRVIFKESRANT